MVWKLFVSAFYVFHKLESLVCFDHVTKVDVPIYENDRLCSYSYVTNYNRHIDKSRKVRTMIYQTVITCKTNVTPEIKLKDEQ